MCTNEHYQYLRDLKCCRLCCLRYLGYRNSQIYTDSRSIEKLGLEETSSEPSTKRVKENICVTCLNLLHEETSNQILDEIKFGEKLNLYDNANIVCAISLPISLNIRALSIWLALLKRFPHDYSKDTPPDVPLKEAWKFIFAPKLVDTFGITVNTNGSGSTLTIDLAYENDEKELESLYKMKPQVFNNRRNNLKKYGNMITRNFFDANFKPEHITFEKFVEYYEIPPFVPDTTLKVKDVNVLGDTIFLAGRYNKFSRTLSQTPWIVDGVRLAESSIQEIIQEPIIKLFKCDQNLVRFSSSGREDVDVRCLGSGRPFVLEMPDTRRSKISPAELRKVEKEINQNIDLMVRDLQIVKREDLIHIKQGEESKTKHYRALCVYTGSIALTNEMLDVLNMPEGLILQQKTPIRVLHRRPLITRPRTVHSMKAEILKGSTHLFYLDVTTQAGTYIKELVHGDFGRTTPNVKDLLMKYLESKTETSLCDINVDIIALDVTAVNLDWPPIIKDGENAL